MSVTNGTKNPVIKRLAIVDRDKALRDDVVKLFSGNGYIIEEFDSSERLLGDSELGMLHCVIISIEPTFSATKKLIRAIKQENGQLAIIAIGNNEEVAQAVTSIRAGADDYVCKPINSGKIRTVVQQLLAE